MAAQVGVGSELHVDVKATNRRKVVIANNIDYTAAIDRWACLASGDRDWGGDCGDNEESSSEKDKVREPHDERR